MNNLEFFLSLEQHNRQTGRTTALAKACEEIGGIFIVSSEVMKIEMKKKYPKLTIGTIYDTNLLIGSSKPVILDHFAWKQVLIDFDNESKQHRAKIVEIRREVLKLKKIINDINI